MKKKVHWRNCIIIGVGNAAEKSVRHLVEGIKGMAQLDLERKDIVHFLSIQKGFVDAVLCEHPDGQRVPSWTTTSCHTALQRKIVSTAFPLMDGLQIAETELEMRKGVVFGDQNFQNCQFRTPDIYFHDRV